MLALEAVVKHFAEGDEVVRAVDGVELRVAAGEVVALYGPSGSGKSTLLQLAAALLRPDAGRVTFEGRDLARLSGAAAADYRRDELGFIMQEFHLMKGVSAVENAGTKLLAASVDPAAARRRATEWLDRVGLGHRVSAPPERLSGGERQRVAIARALTNEPRLILADEPTGSLDSRRGEEILRLLREIARDRGAGVLLVTHDPRAAEVADRVERLVDGRLAAGGGGEEAPAARGGAVVGGAAGEPVSPPGATGS
ncbi:ABC transporter ATP-binding protein [Conexibacter arvalis]|uniref:Putative ABC transport system ATP-binding protein n=1 Tax=Conexibacter arvalis TaxID=912552 RepID=A0A840IIH7_9ACTN|nr:ABC transporter ATP-binding protein [Conexibacter arvalis]MBB4663834.1 putative ABC transport system ATP-binding protein [Conexibacter arvalis]